MSPRRKPVLWLGLLTALACFGPDLWKQFSEPAVQHSDLAEVLGASERDAGSEAQAPVPAEVTGLRGRGGVAPAPGGLGPDTQQRTHLDSLEDLLGAFEARSLTGMQMSQLWRLLPATEPTPALVARVEALCVYVDPSFRKKASHTARSLPILRSLRRRTTGGLWINLAQRFAVDPKRTRHERDLALQLLCQWEALEDVHVAQVALSRRGRSGWWLNAFRGNPDLKWRVLRYELEHGDPGERLRAARRLNEANRITPEELRSAVLAALQGSDVVVRSALDSLPLVVSDLRDAAPHIEALLRRNSPRVWSAAAKAVMRLTAVPEAQHLDHMRLVERMATHREAAVRHEVLRGLPQIAWYEDEALVLRLLDGALDDPIVRVRRQAADTLGYFAQRWKELHPLLERRALAGDPDREVAALLKAWLIEAGAAEDETRKPWGVGPTLPPIGPCNGAPRHDWPALCYIPGSPGQREGPDAPWLDPTRCSGRS